MVIWVYSSHRRHDDVLRAVVRLVAPDASSCVALDDRTLMPRLVIGRDVCCGRTACAAPRCRATAKRKMHPAGLLDVVFDVDELSSSGCVRHGLSHDCTTGRRRIRIESILPGGRGRADASAASRACTAWTRPWPGWTNCCPVPLHRGSGRDEMIVARSAVTLNRRGANPRHVVPGNFRANEIRAEVVVVLVTLAAPNGAVVAVAADAGRVGAAAAPHCEPIDDETAASLVGISRPRRSAAAAAKP